MSNLYHFSLARQARVIPGLEEEGGEPLDKPDGTGEAELPDSERPATLGVLRDMFAVLQRGQDEMKGTLEKTADRIELAERERHIAILSRLEKVEARADRHSEEIGNLKAIIAGARTRISDGWKLLSVVGSVIVVICTFGWFILDKLDDAVRARQAFDRVVTEKIEGIDNRLPPPAPLDQSTRPDRE